MRRMVETENGRLLCLALLSRLIRCFVVLCFVIMAGCYQSPWYDEAAGAKGRSAVTWDEAGQIVDKTGEARVEGDEIVAKGQRLLGLGITEGSIGYESAFAAAQSVGIQFVELPQQWDEVEIRKGKFESPLLAIANQAYSASKTSLVLSLNPIDTNSVRVPKHLIGKRFDDPEVVASFKLFVDFVHEQLVDVDVVAISIGNEVDGVLGADSKKWKEYSKFFATVAQHVREKKRFKDVPCGVKLTFDAAMNFCRTNAQQIHASADAMMITYYPLDEKFKVRKPSAIAGDIDSLIELAGGKPVYLLETGYPSGADNQSSLGQQANFIDAIFKAWDKHQEQIRMVNFVWLHEMSVAEVNALTKYYGVKLAGFRSFLATLGLRTNHGRNKPAFLRLKKCARARGW